jgi:hypothetical protein
MTLTNADKQEFVFLSALVGGHRRPKLLFCNPQIGLKPQRVSAYCLYTTPPFITNCM